MARLSRYFTPPMNSSQRQLFLEMTLISHLSIRFKEMREAQLLYSQKTLAGILRSMSPMEYRESNHPVNEVCIHLNELGSAPKPGNLCSQGFFSEVAPYPFNLLFLSGTGRPSLLDFKPAEFSIQIHEFAGIVKRLETEMEESELCLLWIKRDQERLPLLFHFVRRRLVRVGSVPELIEIGLAFDERKLDSEDLRQFFGTQTSLFSLDLSCTYLREPSLTELTACWERTLYDPQMRVRSPLAVASLIDSTYPELQL